LELFGNCLNCIEMIVMAKKKKTASGSIKITPETHGMIKDFCGKKLNVGAWCDEVLKNEVIRQKQVQDEKISP